MLRDEYNKTEISISENPLEVTIIRKICFSGNQRILQGDGDVAKLNLSGKIEGILTAKLTETSEQLTVDVKTSNQLSNEEKTNMIAKDGTRIGFLNRLPH